MHSTDAPVDGASLPRAPEDEGLRHPFDPPQPGDVRPGTEFLSGGGDAGALMRARDWSASALGGPESWPQPLKTLVGVMLGSNQPMFVAWGVERTLFYNDGYARILAAKHPAALGRDLLDVWREIRSDILPIVEQAYAGVSFHIDDLRLVMQRRGYPEETYFSFFYAPVRDEAGRVGGLYCACTEKTAQVLAERRREALLRLDDRLRDVGRIADLSFTASELLGAALGASRVGYGVVDSEAGTVAVERNWSAPGFTDVAGVHDFSDYGSYLEDLRQGRAVANADVELDRRTVSKASAFRALGIRAHLDVPVVERGRTVAQLFVHSPEPRAWTDEEVAFVREFAERTHAAIARRVAENALREREARLAFLDRLGAETAAMADADAILATTTRLLGNHLDLSVCAYADMDDDANGFTIRGDWAAPGATSIVGHYRLADFGRLAVKNLSGGLPLVVNDNLLELAPEEAATFRNIGIAATVCMPLVKKSRLTALMAIHDRVARVWTEADLALLREVTARSWAHVERVAATAELRASEARFRLTADAVPQIVWITDAEGRAEFFNRQWSDYTGVPYEPMTAAEVAAQHVHPDDVAATVEAFAQSRRSGAAFLVEHRIRSRTGEYRWFLVRGEPHRDTQTGSVVRWFGASVDIHDRRQAEAALRSMNETLEAQVAARSAERDRLWNLSQDLLARADYAGMMSAVSPAWERVLGWSETELRTRPYATFIHPDDLPSSLEAVARMADTRRPTRLENRLATLDGGWKPIEWTVAPEPDGVHFIAVGRDLSANKAREAELEAAKDALRQAQKMEAVGQLTGGVAHDFNNLLTIIKTSAELLRRPGIADDRRRRYLDAISDTVIRATKLTGQLLAFARRQSLKPEVFDAAVRLQGVTEMLRTIVGPRIRIGIEVAGDACRVEADASQFETALVNMAVNARDAMDGEGTLTIRVDGGSPPPTGGDGREQDRGVSIALVDTGHGIPADELPLIFEPFFTTKEVGKGTGLGLSQVFGFAKQSGGDVTVASTVGRGTTFTLYLPRVGGDPQPLAPDAPVGAEPDGPGAGRRILLVEDNVDVGRSSTQLLQDLGYETTWAESGQDALNLLAGTDGFDAVFSDVVMPGMSGIELGQEVRRRHPGLPVVLTSGYSHVLAEEGRHGFELLHKPYAIEDLAKVLRRATRDPRSDADARATS